MKELASARIVVGICGGVAAYKAAYLVRELRALGAHVRVVMTEAAQAFISPMTLQALSGEEVRCALFDETAEQGMGHIELARWADYLLIAPATADFIAKMTHGFADDLLSTLCLATIAPVIVCPAMNVRMWAHAATQANVAILTQRGVMFIGPDDGLQACGDQGLGRMVEVPAILAALRVYGVRELLQGCDVLITAGPTQEAIDPVRYISNRSSGKMAYALAQAAFVAGARVTLISGPCALPTPLGIQRISVTTAEDMLAAVLTYMRPGMIFIGAAAVADYAVASPSTRKLKRQNQATLTLTLRKNPDILAAVVAQEQAARVVGFAAETENVVEQAEAKRVAKGVDIMIANQVGEGIGFDSDNNQATICINNIQIVLPLCHKLTLSGQIISIVSQVLRESVRNCYESLDSN